jgi:hypothetical protein
MKTRQQLIADLQSKQKTAGGAGHGYFGQSVAKAKVAGSIPAVIHQG